MVTISGLFYRLRACLVPLKHTFKKNKPKKVLPHGPAVLLEEQSKKASRPPRQALYFRKTSHSNMRMEDSRRLRNVI